MLRWLCDREDPRTIGLFRIALGALLIADVATLWPHAAYLYGDEGSMPAAQVCGQGLRMLSALCWLPAHVFFVTFFVFALAFTVGLRTRVTKWVTAYLFLSIILRNNIALAGEQVFGNFLFLLCLSRCEAAYSIDARGRPLRAIPAWPRRLMILQLCIAFGVAGWAKTGATWVDGTSLYYVLANDRWVRFEPWWLLSTFGTNVIRVASWGAWWFERLFPLVGLRLLFGDRVAILRIVGSRRIWASLALVFTGTLAVLANIGWFVPATLAAVVVLFRGEEVGRVLRRPVIEAPPLDPSAPTWRTRVLAVFVAWHAFAMIVNAFSLPNLRLPAPSFVREATQTWGQLTNTWQFWGMFSPNVRKARSWLIVDVITQDGDTVAAFDDRQLLGAREYPYLFLDRRTKITGNIVQRDFKRAHARHVCRTWRDPNGHAPQEVVLSERAWPLPGPNWLAENGPTDPRLHAERYREQEELYRLPCH